MNSTTNNSNEPKLTTSFAFLAGQFPPPCLFGVNCMKKSIDVEKFISWHHEQSKWFFENSLVYDFKKELVEYCDSYVKLLKNGFLEHRRLMMQICSDIDPFQVACTAASACNFIYRQLFMPEDSIAIIPVTGYSGREKNVIHCFSMAEMGRASREKELQQSYSKALSIRKLLTVCDRKGTKAGPVQSYWTFTTSGSVNSMIC